MRARIINRSWHCGSIQWFIHIIQSAIDAAVAVALANKRDLYSIAYILLDSCVSVYDLNVSHILPNERLIDSKIGRPKIEKKKKYEVILIVLLPVKYNKEQSILIHGRRISVIILNRLFLWEPANTHRFECISVDILIAPYSDGDGKFSFHGKYFYPPFANFLPQSVLEKRINNHWRRCKRKKKNKRKSQRISFF